MTFKPNTYQLELIAELANARAPVSGICAALGITEAEFSAWAGRLVAARPTRTLTPAEPRLARVVAERLFDGDPVKDGTNGLVCELF